MAKLTLTDILAGYDSNEAFNANWDAIIAAIENTLSRDGTTPNQMAADLDMNGYSILNQKATSGGENFIWKGDWATSTVYAVNNLVYVTVAESAANGGATYICTTAHTSGADFDSDIANWDLFAKRGGAGAGTGDMLSTNNLSDVASAATSRTNLGLGTIATQDANSVAITGGTISGGTITGITDLVVADGGTGASTFTDGGVLIGNGTGAIQVTTAGTSGQVLTSTGAGSDPTFQDAPAGAWELISSASITAVASIDVTFDETTYNEIKIVVEDAIPAIDNVYLRWRLLYSNGASVETANVYRGDISPNTTYWQVHSVDGLGGSTPTTLFSVGTAAGEGCSAKMELTNFATTYSTPTAKISMGFIDPGGTRVAAFDDELYLHGGTARAYDGVRLFWSLGNFEANGTIKVYGLKRT